MSRRLLPSKLDTKPRRKRNSTVERTRLDNSKTKETKEDLKSPSEVFTILSSSKSSKLGNTGNVINVHPNIPSTVNETDSINKENNSVHSQALQSKSEQSDIESVWTARTAENSDNTLEKVRLEENNRASKERIKIKNLDESSGDIYSRRIPLPALKPFQLNALGDSQINCDIQNREIGVPPTKSVIKKKDPPCASQFFWPRSPISNKSTESGIKIFLDSVEDDSPSKEVVSHLKAPLCRLSQADTDSTNELHKESSDTSPMKPDKSQSKISEAGQASNKENNNEGCNETKTAGPSDKLADNDLSPHNASKTLNAYSPSCTSKIPLHPHDESTISIHPEEDALSIMKDKSSRGEEASQEITEEELNSGSTVSSGTQHYSPFYEKNEMLSPSFSGDDDSVLKCSGKHIQSQKNSDCDDDGLSWVNRPMLSLQERTQDIDVRQGRENIIEKRTGKMELNPLSPPPAIRKTNDVGYNDRVSSLRTRDKSMESEVEGVIKDLLFLGNENMSKPGRREQIEEPIFSPTHETASVDTDAISSSSSISRSAASSLVCQDDEETGNDPVITILSGVSAALSEAFGIQLEDDGDDSDDFSESAASTIAFSSIKNAMNVGNAVNYATEKILRPAAAEAVDIILGSNDDAPKKRRPRKGGESRSLLLPEIDDSIASHNMKKNHKSREKLSIRPKSKTGDTAFGPSSDIGKANTRRQLKKSYLSGIIAPTETDHVLANPHHNDPTCFPHKRSYLVEKAKTVHMTFGPLEDAEKIEKKRELGIKYTNQNVASAGTHGVLAEPSHSCVVSARFIKETYPWKEDSNSIKSTTLLDPMIRKQLQVPSLKERKSRETSRRVRTEMILVGIIHFFLKYCTT